MSSDHSDNTQAESTDPAYFGERFQRWVPDVCHVCHRGELECFCVVESEDMFLNVFSDKKDDEDSDELSHEDSAPDEEVKQDTVERDYQVTVKRETVDGVYIYSVERTMKYGPIGGVVGHSGIETDTETYVGPKGYARMMKDLPGYFVNFT